MATRPPSQLRRRAAGVPLQTRLLVAVIALMAVVCLAIGAVTVTSLRSYLVGQLDGRLADAGRRTAGGYGAPPHGSDGDDHGPLGPGQGPGTLFAAVRGGQVDQGGWVDANGSTRQLPEGSAQVLAALPADGRPRTRGLGDLGRYRLQATQTPDGDTLVTGLPLDQVDATTYRLAVVVGLVALAGLLAAAAAGAVIVRRTLRPLQRVAATASRVAELPLDRGEVALAERVPEADTDPRTEVGQVGAALNRMLGHVAAALAARQASETKVRRFVADASHELRTPLAAIRGYAELTRRVDQEVPSEVLYAMDRVESEAKRMTTLVEELLLLARLDAGRATVRAPVDLSSLLVDAVSDAHAAGPEHAWRLELPEEPVTVTGDADQLHQVMANLLANARAHTPPGTKVTVSLASEGGRVLVEVADDGPGIPEALLPEVFERFARGDASRSRAGGNTGLGLAIVAAVVAAHGGTVDVASRPGRTAFTVALGAAEPAPSRPGRSTA